MTFKYCFSICCHNSRFDTKNLNGNSFRSGTNVLPFVFNFVSSLANATLLMVKVSTIFLFMQH